MYAIYKLHTKNWPFVYQTWEADKNSEIIWKLKVQYNAKNGVKI